MPGGRNKAERWERLAVESRKQCRRTGVMRVEAVTPLAAVLAGPAGWGPVHDRGRPAGGGDARPAGVDGAGRPRGAGGRRASWTGARRPGGRPCRWAGRCCGWRRRPWPWRRSSGAWAGEGRPEAPDVDPGAPMWGNVMQTADALTIEADDLRCPLCDYPLRGLAEAAVPRVRVRGPRGPSCGRPTGAAIRPCSSTAGGRRSPGCGGPGRGTRGRGGSGGT